MAEKKELSGVLRCQGEQVSALNFLTRTESETGSNQTDLLFSGSTNGSLKLWNLKTKRTAVVNQAHEKSVTELLSCSTTFINTVVASQGRDGYIRLFDVETFGKDSDSTFGIDTKCESFCKFSFAEEGTSILFGCSTNIAEEVAIWDYKCPANEPISKLPAPSLDNDLKKYGMCMQIRLHRNKTTRRLLLTCLYESGYLATADVGERKWITGQGLDLSRTNESPEGSSVALSFDICVPKSRKQGDGTQMARGISGGSGSALTSFTMGKDSSTVGKSFELPPHCKGCSSIKIRPDQKIVAVAGWDNNVHVYGWKKLQYLGSLSHHRGSVQSLAYGFHAGKMILASGASDGHIALWDIY